VTTDWFHQHLCTWLLLLVAYHRRQNCSSGQWFISDFLYGQTPTIDELKQKIKDGDKQFISKMMYFTNKVRGSDSYWRTKRSEVYTWINHHIQEGNGAPSVFMTLSCAEYFWPDIERILKQKARDCANRTIDLDDEAEWHSLVRKYSMDIQEYFQMRTKDFLEKVAKEQFGITHYWCRFEFAKSRGQIHAHLLAITGPKSPIGDINQKLHGLRSNPKRQAEVMDDWAFKHYGLTATHPATDSEGKLDTCWLPRPEGTHKIGKMPCSKRLGETSDYRVDKIELVNTVQMHICSAYCLRRHKPVPDQTKDNNTQCHDKSPREPRKKRKSRKRKRSCRFGSGEEETEGKGDTPGYELQDEPRIERDFKRGGFKKFTCKRNTRRMNQTPMDLLQYWRANCDMQLLIYESDPRSPDPHDIAKVTDYIVAYTCKGNMTTQMESKIIEDIIMR